MRKPITLLIAIMLVIAAAWGLRKVLQPKPRPSQPRSAEQVATWSPSAEWAATAEKEQARAAQRAKRDELHRRILAAQRSRSSVGDPEEQQGEAPSRQPRDTAARPLERDEQESTSEGLRDRTGNHGYLVKAMKEELMPLIDECLVMARERQPALSGFLIIDLEIISDEEIGGVVDTVGPGTDNEVVDPGLLECVTESILSATLPPPPEGGRDPVSFSVPVASEE